MQLLIAIKRTARLIDRALDEVGEHSMLLERQRIALEFLDRSSCSPCISDVARHLRISRQAAQRLAIRLERRGLIAFVCYDDQRLVQLHLTRQGRDAMTMARGKVVGVLCSITQGMQDQAIDATIATLQAIRDRIRRPRYEE